MKVRDVTAGVRVLCPGDQRRRPKISIVTPTYRRNAEGLLTRCLESAIAQTFQDFEHIIVDDGSSDGTEATVRELAARDDRIVYLRHDKNSGLPAVRTNQGVLQARGEAIAFLFDDNVFEPNFLQQAWDALERSGADVVHAQVRMVQPGGGVRILGDWPLRMGLLRCLNTIPNGGVLVRRDFFDRFGLYDPHLALRRICDWDLWQRALSLGARFQPLSEVASTEWGEVSPTSIGNTVVADWMFSHAVMQDGSRLAARTMALRPDAIGEVDVLDGAGMTPYLRDASEWDRYASAFYAPFLTRSGQDANPKLTAPAAVATAGRKRRVLFVGNAPGALTRAWMDALQAESDLTAAHAAEWMAGAFPPGSVDLLILVDCAAGFLPEQIDAHRARGAGAIACTVDGGQAATADPQLDIDLSGIPEVSALLGRGYYFPRLGSGFDAAQATQADRIAERVDLVLSPDGTAKGPLRAQAPEPPPPIVVPVGPRPDDLGPEFDHESLDGLIERGDFDRIAWPARELAAMSQLHRVGAACLTASRRLADGEERCEADFAAGVAAWRDWLVAVARAAMGEAR